MKIIIARTAGFCMGVRRAVEMALDAPETLQKPIYTYGPLIHNPQVLSLLEKKGVNVLDHVPEQGEGTVLIRAHGVPPWVKEDLKKAGFSVVDATCPRVIKVQTIIKKHAAKGFETIIIGDGDHPEVVGLMGYAENRAHVAGTMTDLQALEHFPKAIVVAQTTQNIGFFEQARQWIEQNRPEWLIFNTICDSTHRRQEEARQLATSVDAMIVVGGKNSGNTQRLVETAKQTGTPAFHVETESDLDVNSLKDAETIGITAGASTPNWIIKKIYRKVESLPLHGRRQWLQILFWIQKPLLLTNIYVAMGAGCLTYACGKLQGIPGNFPFVFIAIFYVLSMHILNHLTGTDADHYNDPERADFYIRYKIGLAALALAAGGTGLITALTKGLVPFIILLLMSLMGLSYNLKLLPRGVLDGKYRRIRDIPGSKTVLITLAYGVVAVLFPPLATWGHIRLATGVVFIWATLMVFSRTAFFDILDMQGDRIVGKDTIPILLGEQRANKLLKIIQIVGIGILVVFVGFGVIPGLGVALAICQCLMLIILFVHERGYMLPGIRLEFMVESLFLLTGFIAFLWFLIL